MNNRRGICLIFREYVWVHSIQDCVILAKSRLEWQGSSEEEQSRYISDGQNITLCHTWHARQLGPMYLWPPLAFIVCPRSCLSSPRCLLIQQWKPNKSLSELISPGPAFRPRQEHSLTRGYGEIILSSPSPYSPLFSKLVPKSPKVKFRDHKSWTWAVNEIFNWNKITSQKTKYLNFQFGTNEYLPMTQVPRLTWHQAPCHQ